MGRIGLPELLIILVPLLIGRLIGSSIASGVGEEKRKLVGGVTLLVAVVLGLFGLSSLNSPTSQVMGMFGQYDTVAFAALGFGAMAAMVGLALLQHKSTADITKVATTKKCVFCAEVIQPEAKICRFCNREQVGG